MTCGASDIIGRPGAGLIPRHRDDAILRGYLREHLAVAASLAVAALVALVVLVDSARTLRRVEAHSMPLPGIVVEQLPAALDGWERLSVTYSAKDEDIHAAVTVDDAHAYRVGQEVDLLVDPRLPAHPVLASELPGPWPAGAATLLALAAAVAIAVRSARWLKRLKRLVDCPEDTAEAVKAAQVSDGRDGVTLELSQVHCSAPAETVVFPLIASQQELVDRDRPFPVTVRWETTDPGVMVAVAGGRVLWPRGRIRRERGASLPQHVLTASAGHRLPGSSNGDQALSIPARPASTTKDARVTTGAPSRETYRTTR